MKRAGVLALMTAVVALSGCQRDRDVIGGPDDHSPYGGLRQGERPSTREMRRLHGGGQANPAPTEVGPDAAEQPPAQ